VIARGRERSPPDRTIIALVTIAPVTTLGDWLAQGPFGLAMSSGFFAFYAHTGMLSALVSRGLVPAHVAGSSAGALVGGMWAAGLSCDALAGELARLERADFWDPAPGAGLLAGRKLDARLRAILPVAAIEGCGVPMRISVFDILARRTAVLERGDLATAIRASCAVPGMFHPVWIARRPYWDGGILDPPGIAGAPPGRLLFHHIAWRLPMLRALGIPRRAGLVALVLGDLPRSGPFRLEHGRRAMHLAREATLRALELPIEDGIVRA
jgi:NTE family protein